ncbi:MAG: trimethylamine methyltransferase family protein [bacterium]
MGANRVRPSLSRFLSGDRVMAIHDVALAILRDVGVQLSHEGAQGMLPKIDGLEIVGDRVLISPDLVDRLLEEHRSSQPPTSSDDEGISLGVTCYANHFVDIETDEVRPFTVSDLISMTRLIDGLHALGYPVRGHCPGFPQDISHPTLRPLMQFKIGAEFCRFGGWCDIPSIEVGEYARRMMEVMGQRFSLPLYVVSPLKLDGPSLDRILHFLSDDLILSVSSMPSMGATAPIFFPGALATGAAEVLGGFVVLKSIAPRNPISFYISAFPFDMRHTTLVFGSPERVLLDLAEADINEFYAGRRRVSTSILSMAKRPGVQAAAEKSYIAAVGALSGCRYFDGAGGLALDEVFSGEQLVLDCEIVQCAGRIASGFDFSKEGLSVDLIKGRAGRGFFMDDDSTLEHYRETYWMPQLFERSNLKRWTEAGGPDARDRAKEVALRAISASDFHLDDTKARELDRIYEEARRSVGI